MQADARTPNSEPLKWALSADSEALTWAPHEPTTFLVRLALRQSHRCTLQTHQAILFACDVSLADEEEAQLAPVTFDGAMQMHACHNSAMLTQLQGKSAQ